MEHTAELPILNKNTPLPWRSLSILLLVRLADPLCFSILFPFVYFMVKKFPITLNDAQVGFYVGIIASSFAFSQMLSAIPWGSISDKFGRRPVILIGMLGTSISLFLFGLSETLVWAIFSRSLCGIFSGNVGVINTMMAELTDKSNRAQGFSLLPIIYGIGSILGPILGGFLSYPVENYPWLFKPGKLMTFLTKHPHFLPCALGSLIVFMGFILSLLFLDETLQTNSSTETLSEATPLLNNNNLTKSQSFEIFNGITRSSWKTILAFSFQALVSVFQLELFPMWAATPSLLGGLGFTTSHIGAVISFRGMALLFIQLFFYPQLQKRFGTLKLYQYAYCYLIPITLLFPTVPFLESNFIFWCFLLTLITCRTACNVFIVTSINILLVETCPDKNVLGKVNSIALASGSLVRALGPALCGLIYSWSLSNSYTFPLFKTPLTSMVLTTITIINYLIARRIKVV